MGKPEEISIHQMGQLRVDDQNRLYWGDKPVVTEEEIRLQKGVSIAIITGAGSTAILALIELFRFLNLFAQQGG